MIELIPSESGWYPPMTWKAAFTALSTPGYLPLAVSGQSAADLLRNAWDSPVKTAGVLAGDWSVRAVATMEVTPGADHPRYYATYSLQIRPA